MAQPAPEYVLRGHEAQVNCVVFGAVQDILISGDAGGFVCIWSLETFRPLAKFRAHNDSVLTVSSWSKDRFLLTHGRDNKIHNYDLSAILSNETAVNSNEEYLDQLSTPLHVLEVNAVGFCKCSLLELENQEALVATPSTLEDCYVDIFHLPSRRRIYRSIGKTAESPKTGTVMSMSLFSSGNRLQLFVGYESGQARLLQVIPQIHKYTVTHIEENEGWVDCFIRQGHKEPIMANCIDRINANAWTVGADHVVARYNIAENPLEEFRAYKTPYPGRGSVAVRSDGRILATAGWDGSVRIYSAKSFKPLAVLSFHKDSVYTLSFGGKARPSWLAVAGTDQKISLWNIFKDTVSQ